MASNFQLSFQQTRDRLNLSLCGDFDGSSAFEIINTLNEHGRNFDQVFIDTEDLDTIHPFGKDVFLKNFRILCKKINQLIFTGKHKQEFAS